MNNEDFNQLNGLISADTWPALKEEICLRYGPKKNTNFFSPAEKNNLAWKDNNFDYTFNDLWFRDGPIVDTVDTCYYGCSITAGIGVPENLRWTSLLDNSMSWQSNNFAIPGLSPEECCYLFAQTSKLVTMSRAVFLLPEPYRQCIAEYTDSESIEYYSLLINFNQLYDSKTPIYKTANNLYRLPKMYFIDRARTAINLIRYIAKLNNIEVVISSWSQQVFDLLKYPADTTIVPLDNLGRDCSHPGINYHASVANQFIEIIK